MGRRQHFPSGERVADLERWLWGSPRGRDPARDPTGGWGGGKDSGWHCHATSYQEGSAQPQEMAAPQGVGTENRWPEAWESLQRPA